MTAWQTIRETPRRIGEAASQARPQLRGIISPPRRLSPVTFAVLVVGIVVSGMVGMLVLTTVLQNQAFEVRDAQRTASELGYRASDLEAQVNRVKAPESLGLRATELGMVPNPHAVFIDVSSGEVLGEPIAARGDEMPSLKVRPAPVAPVEPAEGEAAPVDGAAPAEGTTPEEGAAAPVDPAQAEAPAEGVPADEPPAGEAPAEPIPADATGGQG